MAWSEEQQSDSPGGAASGGGSYLARHLRCSQGVDTDQSEATIPTIGQSDPRGQMGDCDWNLIIEWMPAALSKVDSGVFSLQ